MSKKLTCTVLLCGGLGNQLFQLAFARNVSLRSGARLVLDTRTLLAKDFRYRREYELGAFRLHDDISISTTPKKLQSLRFWLYREWDRIRRPAVTERRYIGDESPGIFDPKLGELKLTRSALLKGYWQCPLYFSDYADQIRSDLAFINPVSPKSRDFAREIEATNSVGIHIRRVDYARCLSIEYYQESIERMKRRLRNPKFFMFSDDRGWLDEQFGNLTDVELIAAPGGLSGIEDFQLLSMCKHFVIANSSFSWWAAWLGASDDKQVIAPSRDIWINSWDVLPEDWGVVEVFPNSLGNGQEPQEYGPQSSKVNGTRNA